MKKLSKVMLLILFSAVLTITACKGDVRKQSHSPAEETSSISETEGSQSLEEKQPSAHMPVIEKADWSGYFDGINGGAVVYVPDDNKYIIYNEEVSNTRRSPCSTFKIVSSLIGIEKGIISAENSVREWSGEIFWNEKWNRDIDFKQAFQSSCVWYFRELINDLGRDVIQNELNSLNYGNCDSSDWEGYLNNNNSNRALTGFWVESSLKISPKEQVEVMERIFGNNSVYHENSIKLLKDAMLVTDSETSTESVYGKTGLGKVSGIVVDAWFTGFTELEDKNVYFCIYLGETDNKEVSSTIAKEIALQLIKDEVYVK